EQRDFHVAERGEPLDQEPQGDALADAGLAGDEREAALAGEVLDPPAKALHRRREPQRLGRHVGGEGIPLEAVQCEQLLRHGALSSSAVMGLRSSLGREAGGGPVAREWAVGCASGGGRPGAGDAGGAEPIGSSARRAPSALAVRSSGKSRQSTAPVRSSTRYTWPKSQRAHRTPTRSRWREREGGLKRTPAMLTVPSLFGCVRCSSAMNTRRSASLVGLGRPTSGPARKRASGVSPVSEWTRRLYSSSPQAGVASLSVASVTSGQFSSIASSRPSTWARNFP